MTEGYKPSYLPDGRKAYNPNRTERDIWEEWRAFERRLCDEGVTDPVALLMQSRELWRQEEEAGERWREWQDRVWKPRMAALAAQRPRTELTNEEWAYLAETFADANNPLARSIQAIAASKVQK